MANADIRDLLVTRSASLRLLQVLVRLWESLCKQNDVSFIFSCIIEENSICIDYKVLDRYFIMESCCVWVSIFRQSSINVLKSKNLVF